MTLAMVAGIMGGASIIGGAAQGILGANAASTAASQQGAADQAAIGQENNYLSQAENVNAPYLNTGYGANSILDSLFGIGGGATTAATGLANGSSSGASGGAPSSLNMNPSGAATGASSPNYSSFYNSPGYQFTLNQGEQAINRNASASGNLFSTGTMASLNNYAQGAASTQYNNYVNQMMQLAGMGQTAANSDTSMIENTGANVASLTAGKGAAAASGTLGAASAIGSGIGTAASGISNAAMLAGNSQLLSSYLGQTNASGVPNPNYVETPAGNSGLSYFTPMGSGQ